MKLSIVIPVFNEQDNLHLLHDRLTKVALPQVDDFEIIFVNDGSTDRSLSVMRELSQADPHTKYVSLSRNFGHEIASTAGIDAAGGNAVVLIDADLQDPPELIPELLAKWRQGAGVVYARRRRRDGESILKKIASHVFYRVLYRLADVNVPLDTGDFRLMDRRVVDELRKCRENPRFMRGLVAWVGFRQDEILYDRAQRHAGRTKYNLWTLMRLSWEAVCAFSLMPLRVVAWIGSAVTFLSLLLAAIVAVQKLFFKLPIQGYALLACGIFFLGGIQLILLGVLAHYIGLTFKAAQNRPLYIIEEKHGWENRDE